MEELLVTHTEKPHKMRKSQRKRSSIWTHFSGDSTQGKAQCNICLKNISFKSGSTNNLHRHMKTRHPAVTVSVSRVRKGRADTNGCHPPIIPSSPSSSFSSSSSSSASSSSFPGRPQVTVILSAPASPDAPPDTTKSSSRPQNSLHPTQNSLHPTQNSPHPTCTPLTQTKIDEELAQMIATDFHPFTIVEDRGFKNFCHALNPFYILPSRRTLTQKISDLYRREAAALKQRVSRCSAVSLTTDCWTSRGACFVSVTCHFIEDFRICSSLLDCFELSEQHTAENLARKLQAVAAEWEIAEKVVCCLTDNAAKMSEAVRISGWTHLPCLAHTINLIVKDALKSQQHIVDKVKEVAEYFHKSTAGAQKSREKKLHVKLEELQPKPDGVSRWNSTFYMLQRFLMNKNCIVSALDDTNAPVRLSENEWSILEEMCTVLRPFEEVTVELSAESCVTASKAILLADGLQRATADFQAAAAATQEGKRVADFLLSNMAAKFHGLEFNHALADAAALDPRFKRMAFREDAAAEEAFQRVTAAAAGLSEGGGGGEAHGDAGPPPPPPPSLIWSYFNNQVAESLAVRNVTADAVMEMQSYLEEPLLPKNADPLAWWRSRAGVYPTLTKVMVRKLCLVPTSAPSKRVFSRTGQILSERRSRLKPANIRSLVFLNSNLPKDKRESL